MDEKAMDIVILGADYGTSTSSFGMIEVGNDTPVTILKLAGKSQLPSTICIRTEDEMDYCVPPEEDPLRTIRNNKRLIGQKFEKIKKILERQKLPYKIQPNDAGGCQYEIILITQAKYHLSCEVADALLLQHMMGSVVKPNVGNRQIKLAMARPNRFGAMQTQARASHSMYY